MKITHQRRRQIVPYLFLTVFTGFICWLFVGRHGMFASTIDWISQHSVIPDYFRKQFYRTLFFQSLPQVLAAARISIIFPTTVYLTR